jgi:hypothetical protein
MEVVSSTSNNIGSEFSSEDVITWTGIPRLEKQVPIQDFGEMKMHLWLNLKFQLSLPSFRAEYRHFLFAFSYFRVYIYMDSGQSQVSPEQFQAELEKSYERETLLALAQLKRKFEEEIGKQSKVLKEKLTVSRSFSPPFLPCIAHSFITSILRSKVTHGRSCSPTITVLNLL